MTKRGTLVSAKTGEVVYSEVTDPTPDQINAAAKRNRADAFEREADPLYFKEQRGEVEQGTWAAKVEEIRARFPYQSDD